MRILTVRQPWAWAIIHGGKDVENRTTNIAGGYRGPVAIHVALRDDPAPFAWQRVDPPFYTRGDGQYGSIVGVVDLLDVHWSGMECGRSPARCHEYNPCSPWGDAYQHHLVLANARPLAEPIPYKGALGLRNLAVNDPATTARILAQIGTAA